jgi:hypothetical protein
LRFGWSISTTPQSFHLNRHLRITLAFSSLADKPLPYADSNTEPNTIPPSSIGIAVVPRVIHARLPLGTQEPSEPAAEFRIDADPRTVDGLATGPRVIDADLFLRGAFYPSEAATRWVSGAWTRAGWGSVVVVLGFGKGETEGAAQCEDGQECNELHFFPPSRLLCGRSRMTEEVGGWEG